MPIDCATFGSEAARHEDARSLDHALTQLSASACQHCGAQADPSSHAIDIRRGGPRLRGHLFAPAGYTPKTHTTVLYLSGHGAPAAAYAGPAVAAYLAQDAAICVVDYRGFGQSTGLPDTDGLHHDARRMFEHLIGHLHVPQQKLVLHGYATGATVAAELAACLADEGQGLLGGIVYDRPMASALATVVGDQSTGLGWLGGLLDEADGVSEHHQDLAHTLARIDRRVQTLLIRGEKDALGVSGVHLRRALAALGFDFDEAKLAVDAAHNGYDMLACCSGCIATLCAHAKGA